MSKPQQSKRKRNRRKINKYFKYINKMNTNTRTEQFEAKQRSMSDQELIEIAEKQLSKLCETSCKSFTMSIPPMVDDTDMIYGELIRRFKENTSLSKEKIINASIEASSEILIKAFYTCQLKDGITGTIVNDPTGDTFSLEFKKVKDEK